MASWENLLPEDLCRALAPARDRVTEIRLRTGRPVYVYVGNDEFGIAEGNLSRKSERIFTPSEAEKTWLRLCSGAPYAHEECQRCGFLTFGGHRVGFTGRYLFKNGRPTFLSVPDSFCIRVSRPVLGCALPAYPFLFEGGRLLSGLIVSPPGGGKTTFLRDLARLLSADGFNVGLADERDELAAVEKGIPSFDVGKRCDVISGVAKSTGLHELIRTVRPDAVIADEIGSPEDARAVAEAQTMGTAVFASAHGRSVGDACTRLAGCAFDRFVVLDRFAGRGRITGIYDAQGKKLRDALCS